MKRVPLIPKKSTEVTNIIVSINHYWEEIQICLLYTSDAADEVY